jgi:hypothetical protein
VTDVVRALPALVVVLLVLAGCSSTPVGDPRATDAVTTPAPVPTEDLPENRIAPGVSPEGIVDAERLADAHTSSLSERSYTRTSGTFYRFENGSLLARTSFNRSVDLESDRQLLVRVRTGPALQELHYAEWVNETMTVERIERNGSVSYEIHDRDVPTITGHGGGVAQFLAEQDPRVAGKRTTNGTVEYVLVSPNVTDLNFLEQVGANQTTPTRLVAVVTRQGVVRSLRFTAEGTYRGETVHVTNRYRITGVGETHVERPAWVDTALNATESQNATWTTG